MFYVIVSSEMGIVLIRHVYSTEYNFPFSYVYASQQAIDYFIIHLYLLWLIDFAYG